MQLSRRTRPRNELEDESGHLSENNPKAGWLQLGDLYYMQRICFVGLCGSTVCAIVTTTWVSVGILSHGRVLKLQVNSSPMDGTSSIACYQQRPYGTSC